MLTFCTSLNIFSDFLAKVWPPVITFYEANHVVDSRVSVYWKIMMISDQNTPFHNIVGDNSPSVLVSEGIDVFEFMRVDPRL